MLEHRHVSSEGIIYTQSSYAEPLAILPVLDTSGIWTMFQSNEKALKCCKDKSGAITFLFLRNWETSDIHRKLPYKYFCLRNQI